MLPLFFSNKLAISYGRIIHNLYNAAGDDTDVLKLVKIYPIDEEVKEICMNYSEIYFFEESSRSGGIGERLLAELYPKGSKGKFVITAVDGFVKQASVSSCMEKYGLSENGMRKILEKAGSESRAT